MILIVCVDERMGMMFHHRRLSRDRVVVEDILETCKGKRLLMSPYSFRIFENAGKGSGEICLIEEPRECIGQGDFYFSEDLGIGDEQSIQEIILYHWNRKYPADSYFTMDLGQWNCVERSEFSGTSHENIRKERYERKKI